MTRQNKIQRQNKIYELLFIYIKALGFFDDWYDDYLFEQVARTVGCSVHLVKRIYYKKFYPENKNFIQGLEY